MRQKRGNAADRAGLAFAVVQRHAAFRRGVKFQNPRQGEALLEIFPDIAPQSVAAGQTNAMSPLLRVGRGADEISAKFADILKDRAVPVDDIIPETTDGA